MFTFEMQNKLVFFVILPFISVFECVVCVQNEYCEVGANDCLEKESNNRYLFYDVNPPEGFNLRRDVYIRLAVFSYKLKNSPNPRLNSIKLVLPPWTHLLHWGNDPSRKIPWSHFFDLPSLQKFAPVIELYQFFDEQKNRYAKTNIEEVFILQNFEDMFATGNFEEKLSVEPCNEQPRPRFFYYKNITSNHIKCLAFHGHASLLSTILEKSSAQTILFDHAEIALHDAFGDELYWKARRSMRFNKELLNVAAEFRKEFLNCTNEKDGIIYPDDWSQEIPRRNNIGGPYLAVHLRRRDFVVSRSKEVPSLKHAAKQLRELMTKLTLKKLFIATDGTNEEHRELEALLEGFDVFKFAPTAKEIEKYGDGGIAIVDQIICSYARFFVGTYESTFSFRIQEEREILGFRANTTFNRLCGDRLEKCSQPSQWTIVY